MTGWSVIGWALIAATVLIIDGIAFVVVLALIRSTIASTGRTPYENPTIDEYYRELIAEQKRRKNEL